MKPEAWARIDALRACIDEGTSLTTLGSDAASAGLAIARLAQTLREHLLLARETFERTHLAEAEQLILLLVFFIDERAVHRLPTEHRSSWPWLQAEWLGSITGGRAFFDLSAVLLRHADDHHSSLSLVGYCLANGFRGQYAGDPAQLDAVMQSVGEALGRDKVDVGSMVRGPELLMLPPERPWLVPLIYGSCVLLVLSLLTIFATWT